MTAVNIDLPSARKKKRKNKTGQSQEIVILMILKQRKQYGTTLLKSTLTNNYLYLIDGCGKIMIID